MEVKGESHGVQVQQASKSIEGLEGTDIIHSTNRKCPPTIDEKALVRRIDYRLLPVLFIIYLAAFLDRVNISNALTMSLPKDLGIVGDRTNIALTIFFIPYIIFEIPSNILMKRLKPHVWLSGCILAFGIVMLCQGFVTNYGGLLVTRFFLGLAEAGIFPGSFYLISFWYRREESQKRFTVYWCSVLVATAFGGLLASAIENMNGVRGLASWRWIFILEGIATIVIGITAYFLVPDFPDEVRWLNEEEKAYVAARAKNDEKASPVTLGNIVHFFSDFKNVLGGVMYFAIVIPIYSFAYFAPTIIKTLGYSTVQTQLHTVPPVAAALALCLINAYLSDFLYLRLPFILFGNVLLFTGLGILMKVHHSFSAQYAAICLVSMGAFSAGPIIVCWYVMNLRGHTERIIGTAWMISFGNSGGIVATFAFLASDAPLYRKGYDICISFTCMGTAATIAYAYLARRENRRLRNSGGSEKEHRYYNM